MSGMGRLMLIGLVAGGFFSATFVLNRVMSLGGGHWFWSAALRYGYMLVFLGFGLVLYQGLSFCRALIKLYFQYFLFWVIAGSIGFGCFYALICFSADHSPGWVVATTWQMTIIASLFVLMGFGRQFPKKIWLWALVVFAGVCLVNLGQFETQSIETLILGGIPVLGAAFCYPLGNQLVWEAKFGRQWIPRISDPLLDNAFAKVWLMSAGTIPFWFCLYFIISPGPPSVGQWGNTALVALFSGVVATTLFIYARGKADSPIKLAAVDATQSSEVIFALAGEVVFLGACLPGLPGMVGIFITLVGLSGMAKTGDK